MAITVKNLHEALGKLIDDGKGDYIIWNAKACRDREDSYYVHKHYIDDCKKMVEIIDNSEW